MPQPTKKQWADVAKKLDRLYDTVFFRCDGYLVQAVLGRISNNGIAIAIYVNGLAAVHEWVDGKDEEPRRFWRPITRSSFKQRYIKEMERIVGKDECEKQGLYNKETTYNPSWLRPWPFIRHLIKHNESIEIIDYETYRKEAGLPTEKENVE
ncbi:hypothetical protein [Sulfuriflexus mobilis]|uniref:hypothetical protein n=1 Tax=Sulfuriflexus mobilis TaxID=1811807 RepID=UPI000F822197|nr:hypothetical protein [Sulfuriflexus mobilis]